MYHYTQMSKNQLTICYLTKKQNSIALIASLLQKEFPKLKAFQADSAEEAFSTKDVDLFIVDSEFKKISTTVPVLHVITESEIENFLSENCEFITDKELGSHALVRAVKNIIELKKLSTELQEASIKDELSGLYNQRYLLETLAREAKKAERYNSPLTLLFMGIDGLRKINTTHGHTAGDQVIVDFGLIATNSLRCVDTVGRFSGDEFLAILPETSVNKSLKVCERIQNAVKNFAFANGKAGLNVTVGIGVSELSTTIRTKEELLDSARQALAGAKKRGTNCVCTFDEAKLIDEPTKENRELITASQHQISLLTDEAKKAHFNSILKLFSELPTYKKLISHSEHVAFYSERLASKMGLNQEEITTVRNSAILHDIGKLAIDERIIMKNGPLTSTEYAIVKQHPVFGVQMLSGSTFLKNEMMSILHHHEYFDGNGYPDHMQGTYIPLSARIIALAECWDTMITPQVYRDALPLDEALRELKNGAGKQFDPELVAVFAGLIEG